VDTPRRARASIGKGVDDDVAFVSEVLEKIRPRAGHFPSGDELNTFVSLLQKVAYVSEKFIGIGFVIVQQTNALMAQAAVFSGSELGPLENPRRRWINNLYQLCLHLVPPEDPGFSSGPPFSPVKKDYCDVRILIPRRPSRGSRLIDSRFVRGMEKTASSTGSTMLTQVDKDLQHLTAAAKDLRRKAF
jgi:hypothetical protein